MSEGAIVQIVGAQVACSQGLKDAWRDTAGWVRDYLKARFGEAVRVEYYDLFDLACPPLPAEAQLPLVLVNGEVLSYRGEIPVPATQRRLEAPGLPRSKVLT